MCKAQKKSTLDADKSLQPNVNPPPNLDAQAVKLGSEHLSKELLKFFLRMGFEEAWPGPLGICRVAPAGPLLNLYFGF